MLYVDVNNNSVKVGKEEMKTYCCKFSMRMWRIQFLLKVDCNKLKMHATSAKATTQVT